MEPIAELSAEQLDEISRLVAERRKEGKSTFLCWCSTAELLIAAARELSHIRESSGLTAEQRAHLESQANASAFRDNPVSAALAAIDGQALRLAEERSAVAALGRKCSGLENDREYNAGLLAEAEKLLAHVHAKLKEIVCTVPPDDGVVLLSQDSPTHREPGIDYPIYNYEHFSPLGDALMEMHKLLSQSPAAQEEG